MSKKTHLIIAGLASMTLLAGFTVYVDYFDQIKIKPMAGVFTETAPRQTSTDVYTPAENPFLFSASTAHAIDTPPLQEQGPQALAQADPSPEQPAPPPARPETIPLPNLPSVQTVPQSAGVTTTPPDNSPQINQPAQQPMPPAPSPIKQKTTSTRAS